VYWSLDSVAAVLAGLPEPWSLVAFDVEASFGETRLWAPVNADEDSVTFTYLPEGVIIRYKIRYFARDASGGYGMSHWSDEEFSIQDMSPPVLYPASNIEGLQPGGRLSWVEDRVLQLHVIACDSIYGKIMQIGMREKSVSVDSTLYYDIPIPTVCIDKIIPYPAETPAHEPFHFSWWVVDVAGQTSDTMTVSLFWWRDVAKQARVVCFPNPFRPDQGEMSVIRVDESDEEKASVFDPFGQLIIRLTRTADSRCFEWDGRNARGETVARGGYLFVLDGGNGYCKIAVLR